MVRVRAVRRNKVRIRQTATAKAAKGIAIAFNVAQVRIVSRRRRRRTG